MQTDNKQVIIFGALALVIVLAVIIILMDGNTKKVELPKETTVEAPPAITPQVVDNKDDKKTIKREEILRRLERFPKERQNSLRLSALMDDEDLHDDARELAHKMALEGTPSEKADALTAFEWLGGKDAVDTSIGLLKAGDDYVEQRASDVLNHLIQENLMRDEPLMTTEMWQSLFNQLQNESDIESYMVLLGGYSNEKSVPVLLELAKSERQEIGGKALEHLGSIAYGEEFANREEAEKWFKKYFEKEAQQAQQNDE